MGRIFFRFASASWIALSACAASAETLGPFECLVRPNATVEVASAVNGVVDEVLVKQGDFVEKGQVLARLSSDLERLSYDIAKARAEDDTAVKLKDAEVELAHTVLDRQQQLSESQIVAQAKLEEAATEARLAELSSDQARFEREMAKFELRRAEVALAMREIRAPVSGVVVERKLDPGEYTYEQAQVVTVAQMDPLEVRSFVPAALFREVSGLKTARVHLPSPIDATYEAELVSFDVVFDAASRTMGVRLRLENPDNRLPAGMPCTFEFDDPADTPGANDN
ncbi:efflux RND transporter periplasmic adaptor subunit [Pseudooceanicola sp. LIPI14-2-Ac024]|uniref:efflux RND transporter periplasmic adaptor subunit n=1 Tax=Pseudooceanicola sp. LIPI14-2-Ac024 TaxID=3344875 RepID=UPI0035CED8DF